MRALDWQAVRLMRRSTDAPTCTFDDRIVIIVV
jgi:hypothetical protein